MFRFGFELEGFYKPGDTVQVPPVLMQTDGFAGILEIRTRGGNSLEDAYFSLLREYYQVQPVFCTDITQYKFSAKELAVIRSRPNVKTAVVVNNIYGKQSRLLGNTHLASFQINISKNISFAFTNKDGVYFPERNELFDFVPIIRRLDAEFKTEIRAAGRQEGFYSIKDGCRLEYRSLPCSLFTSNLAEVNTLLARIQKCIN